jgi:hypothetical protein
MSRGPLDGSVSSFASLAAIAPLGFTNSGKQPAMNDDVQHRMDKFEKRMITQTRDLVTRLVNEMNVVSLKEELAKEIKMTKAMQFDMVKQVERAERIIERAKSDKYDIED